MARANLFFGFIERRKFKDYSTAVILPLNIFSK